MKRMDVSKWKKKTLAVKVPLFRITKSLNVKEV